MIPARIVSFCPAATEMLFALGAGGRLVGRSHACDYPPEAVSVPALTRPRLDPSAAGAAIDAAVKAAAAAGQSLYELDVQGLKAAAPDLLLVQDQCAACAVSPSQAAAAFEGRTGGPPRQLAFAPSRFAEWWSDFARLAEAVGAADEGRAVTARLKARVADVLFTVQSVERRPKVAVLDWVDPPMLAGHWVPDLVQLAGGDSVGTPPGRPSAWISWEKLAALDPDVVCVAPCGFGLDRAAEAWRSAEPLWAPLRLRAVKSGRVIAADGNAGFNRPGPRLVESLEALAEALHPALFKQPRRRGAWWRAV